MSTNSTDGCQEPTRPCNFSWVVENRLAAMGWPKTPGNLLYLVDQGIAHLITLSPEKRPPAGLAPKLGLLVTEIPIEEFGVPSFEQIDRFIRICLESHEKNQAVGVHCRQGLGRTGTVAACYLVYFQNLSAQRSVLNVRLQRPGSIENYQQEKFIEDYHDYLRRKGPWTDANCKLLGSK